MALEVQTLEATEVDINTMKFNGELTNLSDYPLALCYFEYGVKPDLSDARKGSSCTLLSSLDSFTLPQVDLEDDKNYYYKASVENYVAAKYQNEYMNECGYRLTTADADTILANSELYNQVTFEKTAMAKVFETGSVSRKFFSVSNNSRGSEVFYSGYIKLYAEDSHSREFAAINIDLDLTNAEFINIDWENNGEYTGYNDSFIRINNSNKISKNYSFDRNIQTINVSNYSGVNNIEIMVEDDDSNDPINARLRIYNLWLE